MRPIQTLCSYGERICFKTATAFQMAQVALTTNQAKRNSSGQKAMPVIQVVLNIAGRGCSAISNLCQKHRMTFDIVGRSLIDRSNIEKEVGAPAIVCARSSLGFLASSLLKVGGIACELYRYDKSSLPLYLETGGAGMLISVGLSALSSYTAEKHKETQEILRETYDNIISTYYPEP